MLQPGSDSDVEAMLKALRTSRYALELDPARMQTVRDQPFARLDRDPGPGPELAYYSNCVVRLVWAGIPCTDWLVRSPFISQFMPGDCLDSTGALTFDEDASFERLLANWGKTGFEVTTVVPNFGRLGPTGVPRVDRIIASVVVFRELLEQAYERAEFGLELEPSTSTRGSAAAVSRDGRCCQLELNPSPSRTPVRDGVLNTYKAQHSARSVVRSDAAGLAVHSDLCLSFERPLEPWQQIAFLHQRLRDRCEKLLSYAQDRVHLPETRWLAGLAHHPIEWGAVEVRRLDSVVGELRYAVIAHREHLPRAWRNQDIESLTPSNRAIVEVLADGVPRSAKQIAIELGLMPTDTWAISKRIERARGQNVPIERTNSGYVLRMSS